MDWKKYYKRSAVYKITIVDKIYVGSSSDIYHRYISHKRRLLNNKHENRYVQAAYNEFKCWKFEILEEFDSISRKDLLKRETYYINLLKPVFNTITDPFICNRPEGYRKSISDGVKRAYKEGRLINPWSLTGNYIDVYDYNLDLIYKNILVKDAITKVKVSNRSVINNAIRLERFIIKDYIVVPTNFNINTLSEDKYKSKYKHLIKFKTIMPSS